MSFYEDLKHGQGVERQVAEILWRQGARDFVFPKDYFKDWDFQCSFGTYEVKSDAFDNGRVFIEHSYKGNPSGLRGTKADYFVIVKKGVVHILPTKELRQFLNSNSFELIDGGDDRQSKGVLLSTEDITATYIAGAKEYPLP
jgi:hypothetical protein